MHATFTLSLSLSPLRSPLTHSLLRLMRRIFKNVSSCLVTSGSTYGCHNNHDKCSDGCNSFRQLSILVCFEGKRVAIFKNIAPHKVESQDFLTRHTVHKINTEEEKKRTTPRTPRDVTKQLINLVSLLPGPHENIMNQLNDIYNLAIFAYRQANLKSRKKQ